MDDTTKKVIDDFLTFLTNEFQSDKHLRHVQFEKWNLNNFRVEIKYFYKDKEGHVVVDIRELKENKNHFTHLRDNIISQLADEIKIN